MTDRAGEKGSCGMVPGSPLALSGAWPVLGHQVAWRLSRALKHGSLQARDCITFVSGFSLWAQNSGFQKLFSIYKRNKLLGSRLLTPLYPSRDQRASWSYIQ